MNDTNNAMSHLGAKTATRARSLSGRALAFLALAGCLLIFTTMGNSRRGNAQPERLPTRRALANLWTQLPLSFEANEGQTNPRVRYLAHGPGYTLFLTSHEAVLSLLPPTLRKRHLPTGWKEQPLRMRLLGAASTAGIAGNDPLPGYSNYFIGNNPKDWHTHIPHYGRVVYRGIYRGVDLVYDGHEGLLESNFVVQPGGDVNRIAWQIEGAKGLRLNRRGDLVVKVAGGAVELRRPRAYQAGREVAVSYHLGAHHVIGFRLGPYNRRQQLTIDPVLAYSTYLGGTGGDVAYGVAVDSSGNIYVAGITNSANFPTTIGAAITTYSGNGDAFIAKINPSGSATSSSNPQLVYSTFLGGLGTDSAAAIAVNAGGDAYVTGSTTSSNFPVTTGVFQNAYKGNGDAFVAELNSTGTQLVYSSYLGGTGADAGLGITVDSSGNAYVTGSTESPDFPTVNPLQSTNHGASDAFVAKINFTGSQLIYSTYLGGSGADVGQAIQVDKSGDAYVAGYTFSKDFPLQNPEQGANAGTVNAFVSELNPQGSSLLFSTYLGGSTDDRAFGLAVDGSGNIYVTGSSTSPDFPTTVGAFQSSNHGQSDAFVAKLNPSGPTLVYSTLLGGSGTDQGNGIAVDSSGDAYVTGFTESNDFPLQNPTQAILGITAGSLCGSTTCPDAFISEVNPSGTGLIYSSFLGGSGADFGQAIALDSSGNIYLAGSTSSNNFPAIAGAYQSSLTGVAGNAFVAKIEPANSPGIAIVPATLNFGNQTVSVRSTEQIVTVVNEGTAPLTISQITSSNTAFAETDNCVGTLSAGGASCTINVTFTPTAVGTASGTLSITDNASGSPQTIKVTGTGVTAATAVTLTPTSLTFGNQTVGTTSSPQTITITNTGSSTLDINSITTTGDFAQTNNCGAFSNVLNVGQSCTASVTFTPTASGARAGTLSVNDNATGSPQSASLSGTGVAVFSMSSPDPSVTSVVSSSGSATFKVSASAPSGFTGSITLSSSFCTTYTAATCAFNPASILSGQTSTLTITNIPLTVATNNDDNYTFTVAGTSGSQSATTNLHLLFEDYSLSATPSLDTVVAGAPATYTIQVTPINGFNKQVTLACGSGMPPGATCAFSNSTVTPNGSPSSIALTINTTKNGSVPPPAPPPTGGVSPYWVGAAALVILLALLELARRRRRFPDSAKSRWLPVQVGMLCLLFMLELFFAACRPATTTATGSTPGGYTITITGTLSSDTTVVRSTTLNLEVTPNS